MKRIRLFVALLLCLALMSTCSVALAASKKVPTIKITVPNGDIRGGIGVDLTLTPSVPGFLTLTLLNSDTEAVVATICENYELHTSSNIIEFTGCDDDGEPLPAGSYTLSAAFVNQYGTESKVTTAKLTLDAPRPELSDVSVSVSSSFRPEISFYATFDDKSASVTLTLTRLDPYPMVVDDFPTVELKESGMASTSLQLKTDKDVLTNAGYYQVKGALVEDKNGVASKAITVEFVLDENGDIYLTDEAPEEVLLAVDEIVDAVYEGTYGIVETKPAASTTAKTPASSGSQGASSAASQTLAYEAAENPLGDEGLQIGVGVTDVATQDDAGYWALTSESADEEIWAAITRTMISVNVDEKESAYIYDSPYEGRKRLGTVSGLSQGLNVVHERDDGWTLVEAFRNEDGAFIRGYIRTNTLRIVEPNTTYGIVIDKAAQTLTVWQDGAPIGSCLITTGLATEKYLHRETPAGEFITVTRRGTTEYYGSGGFSLYTIRINGNYHLSEIPSTKKGGSDFSLLEGSLGTKATRGNICIAHDASADGGINAEWIWNLTDTNKKVKVLILDDKDRSEVPVGE